MRQVYTESQKRKFVQAYEESSLTIRDYCRSVKISPSLFYQTRKSLIKEESLNKKVSSSSLFHQIVKPTVGSGISLTLSNGIKIGLEGMSMEDLSRLLVSMGRHA
jgi:hypothetical protein